MPPRKCSNKFTREDLEKQQIEAERRADECVVEKSLGERYRAILFTPQGDVITHLPPAVITILSHLKCLEEESSDETVADDGTVEYVTIWGLCSSYYKTHTVPIEYVRAFVSFIFKMVDYGLIGATDDAFPLVYSNELSRITLLAYTLGASEEKLPF